MADHIAGEKFRPSASREREVDRLLRDAREGRTGLESPNNFAMRPGHVLAKNNTGADLAFGKAAFIAGLGGAYVTSEPVPRKDWNYQKGYYTLTVLQNITSDPVSDYPSSLAITVEPIKSNEFGIVAIAGLAVCSEGLGGIGYARPYNTQLVSGNWGMARIVTQESTSSFSILNLDDHQWFAPYKLTAALGTSSNAKIDPGGAAEYTTTVYDDQSIASWQVVGDKGLAFYSGSRWQIRVPWCVT